MVHEIVSRSAWCCSFSPLYCSLFSVSSLCTAILFSLYLYIVPLRSLFSIRVKFRYSNVLSLLHNVAYSLYIRLLVCLHYLPACLISRLAVFCVCPSACMPPCRLPAFSACLSYLSVSRYQCTRRFVKVCHSVCEHTEVSIIVTQFF